MEGNEFVGVIPTEYGGLTGLGELFHYCYIILAKKDYSSLQCIRRTDFSLLRSARMFSPFHAPFFWYRFFVIRIQQHRWTSPNRIGITYQIGTFEIGRKLNRWGYAK